MIIRRVLPDVIRGFRRLFPKGFVVVDERERDDYMTDAKCNLIDSLTNVAASYIAWGRTALSNRVCSKVEMAYFEQLLPADFDDLTDDEQRAWLDEHRDEDDKALVLYVIQHYDKIELKRYRLQIFYILSTLAITEKWFHPGFEGFGNVFQ